MLTTRHLFLISTLAISAIFVSCQPATDTTASAEQVRGSFYVRYLAEANELKGQANFYRADSTALQLAKGVAFMGSGTRERILPGEVIRYEATMNARYPNDLRFNFQLPGNDTPTEVKYSLSSIPAFEVVSASKENGLVLDFDGTLQKGETLLLLFTDPNQEARTVLRPGPLSRDQLFIPADAIAHFIPGAYRLYLVKQVKLKEEKPSFAYDFSLEYYTPETTFTLTE